MNKYYKSITQFNIMTKNKKNPWIAGVLNFLFPGLGYLYIRKRVNFGAMIFFAMILMYFYTLSISYLSGYCGIENVQATVELSKACAVRLDYFEMIVMYPAILLFWFALGYDAYSMAKE